MKQAKPLPLLLIVSILLSCGGRPKLELRSVDQTAKRDMDDASLVILAKVESIEDRRSKRNAAGYGPIYAKVTVLRVLKGALPATRACLVYLFPYGGYTGGKVYFTPAGMTGIFSLKGEEPCYRIVNDRRAVIPITHLPSVVTTGLEETVAEATLPALDGRCSNGGLYEISNELSKITIPLVGMRRAIGMLRESADPASPTEQACACVISDMSSMTNDACEGRTHPSSEFLTALIARVQEQNTTVLAGERDRFVWNTVAWLKFTIENRGLDGTLLELRALQSLKGREISSSSCELIGRGLSNGELDRSMTLGLERAGAVAEKCAREQLAGWVASGCAASYSSRHFLACEDN